MLLMPAGCIVPVCIAPDIMTLARSNNKDKDGINKGKLLLLSRPLRSLNPLELCSSLLLDILCLMLITVILRLYFINISILKLLTQ